MLFSILYSIRNYLNSHYFKKEIVTLKSCYSFQKHAHSTIYFFHFVFQTGLSLLICYVVSRVLQHEYRELYRHLRTMYPEPPEWKLNAICFFVHTIIIYLHVVLRFDRGVICIVLSNIAVFLFLFKYSFCLHMYIVWLYGKG